MRDPPDRHNRMVSEKTSRTCNLPCRSKTAGVESPPSFVSASCMLFKNGTVLFNGIGAADSGPQIHQINKDMSSK